MTLFAASSVPEIEYDFFFEASLLARAEKECLSIEDWCLGAIYSTTPADSVLCREVRNKVRNIEERVTSRELMRKHDEAMANMPLETREEWRVTRGYQDATSDGRTADQIRAENPHRY